MNFTTRLKNAWNAFLQKENRFYPYNSNKFTNGYTSFLNSSRPDRATFSKGNERSIVTSVYNRISIDVSSLKFRHVQIDENERYLQDKKTGLNDCLKFRANKDQCSRPFIQDCVISLLDEGSIAIVPVDLDINPDNTSAFDIYSMRVGKITGWFPDYVEVEVYNDRKGIKEKIMCNKQQVAIIENPLYSVINAPNSTLQRLIRKLNILDAIDEQSGSGKLDLIVQLPYIIKTETRKQQAEQRRKDIEDQLSGSKYGIAYTDGTEKITQLNRPIENNLMKQIEFLTSMLYSQLGITEGILNGTAKPEELLNYLSRTVEPIASAITDEMTTKFLSTTAITQGQRVMFFNDPFKLVPMEKMADIADKFTRNAILSSNELRQIVGFKPVNDVKADELSNKNLNPAEGQEFPTTQETVSNEEVNEEDQRPIGEITLNELRNAQE